MPKYCLDANILIEANKGPYGIDFHKTFWDWLDVQNQAGVICSSIFVYDELQLGDQDLFNWATARRDAFFLRPSRAVQTTYSEIGNYVTATYNSVHAPVFLSGADPWIIAQAKADGAIVVTHETLVPLNSSKVKIPNVCNRFNVEWTGIYNMLRHLKAKF